MGLFDKIKGPAFLKDDSEADRQLESLKELLKNANGKLAKSIEQEISRVEAGIYGEQSVKFELENSHMPMIVLHDLFLEYEGLTAQIDYLILTRKRNFVVECKNLYGNIEINSAGDFIRTMEFGRIKKKEGIYSPITQNTRHMELIKKIRAAERGNFLTKAIFEKNFYQNYRSIVVLANPKTVLNAKYAKKEDRNRVIRADQLVSFIKKINSEPETVERSEKDMENLAQFFIGIHKDPKVDYVTKFREALEKEDEPENEKEVPVQANELKMEEEKSAVDTEILCPRCGAPMVLRRATRGDKDGQEFYGCSAYPKCRGIVQVRQ